jgi:hypothetical protein
MNTHPILSYDLPSGKYFIGDISYFLNDKYYTPLKENLFGTTGKYTFDDGKTLVMMKTYGDTHGSWFGSNDEMYYVHAGVIGVCPLDIGYDSGNGSIHDFKNIINIDIYEQGILKITCDKTKLIIDTSCDSFVEEDDIGYDSWS